MDNYFALTGTHKSGNSWLGAMLFSVTTFNGNTNPIHSMLRLDWILNSIKKFNKKASIPLDAQQVVMGLLNPLGTPPLKLVREDRDCLTEALNYLSSKIRFSISRAGIDTPHNIQSITNELMSMLCDEQPIATFADAFGCPSKHMTINWLRTNLPDFRVVWIIRDPRDVLISGFYHDLGHLTVEQTDWFCEKTWLGFLTGKVQQRKDGLKRYLTNRCNRQLHFFRDSIDYVNDPMVLTLRYEDLLSNCKHELRRMLSFIGVNATMEKLDSVIERFSFRSLTGGLEERRFSNIRKGQVNDWKNYFDRRIVAWLSKEFIELVCELGYENSITWSERLPEVAPKQFDFSRFQYLSSAVQNFQDLWLADEGLQYRFPCIFEDYEGDSFFNWLRSCNQLEVRKWMKQAEQLVDLWGGTSEVHREEADALLNY